MLFEITTATCPFQKIKSFFNYNNKFCPRDAKDQFKHFKKKIELKNIRKNDLIFWKGHVAVVISNSKLIHAYGPFKKVVVMPIKKTINKIYETAKLKVIGIRRIGWDGKEWRHDSSFIV